VKSIGPTLQAAQAAILQECLLIRSAVARVLFGYRFLLHRSLFSDSGKSDQTKGEGPMVTAELNETPEYGAQEDLRQISCDLDDLRSLLDALIYSHETPDNIRSVLRPISAVLGSVGDRAETQAEVWLEKAQTKCGEQRVDVT
jgi:hypothetical protein